MEKCISCGGRLEAGELSGFASVKFRPKASSWWQPNFGAINVDAFICRECGAIGLRGNRETMEWVLGKRPPEGETKAP